MSEPSYREQLRMRLEAGMTRTAGPSQVGPVERSGTQPAPEKAVEAIQQPVGAARAADEEEPMGEKRRVRREALGGVDTPPNSERQRWLAQRMREMASPVALQGRIWPRFKDREVVCYIDNTAALCSYAKAASSDVASARMVHEFHALCHMLCARVWFSWVPSKSNIADLPSRNEFSLLQELGSDAFAAVIPRFGASWADVILESKVISAVNLRARERRWLKEATDAIAAEAQRRAARAAAVAGP